MVGLLHAVHSSRRIRRAEQSRQDIAARLAALTPLRERWLQYQKLEDALPAEPTSIKYPLPADIPKPDHVETNRTVLSETWSKIDWNAEWSTIDYVHLPILFRQITEARTPWRITELRMGPAVETGRGRFVLGIETVAHKESVLLEPEREP